MPDFKRTPTVNGVQISVVGHIHAVMWFDILNTPDTLAGYGITLDAWAAPSFTNSWANYGSPFNTAGYKKDPFGFVHLKGTIKSGTIGASAFTLPAGYRPIAQNLIATISNGALGYIQVTTAGAVIPSSPSSNAWVSLDNIIIPIE